MIGPADIPTCNDLDAVGGPRCLVNRFRARASLAVVASVDVIDTVLRRGSLQRGVLRGRP